MKPENSSVFGHTYHGGVNDSEGEYQCPMKCEGDKIYDRPGRCPVCNMHLAPVKKR